MQNAPAKQHDVSMLVFPPIVHAVWGVVLLIGFFFGMLLQMQSTEAWMQGEHAASLVPNLGFLAQFPDFLGGHLSPGASTSFLVAVIVEMTYVTIKLGTARPQAHIMRKYSGAGVMTDAIVQSARIRRVLWSVISWGIILFNAFTDWQYSTDLGGWQQLAFIVIVGAATFYFGTFGVQNLVAGVTKMAN